MAASALSSSMQTGHDSSEKFGRAEAVPAAAGAPAPVLGQIAQVAPDAARAGGGVDVASDGVGAAAAGGAAASVAVGVASAVATAAVSAALGLSNRLVRFMMP